MTSNKDRILYYVLKPFSWLYGAVTEVRNKCFDWGWLPSQRYEVPVVSVGNITVGGTGKTPHVEFLIESLSSWYNIAVLSRGYKRRTKGYVLASRHSTPETIGDEPFQIYQKFGKRVKVAVCENRRKGIEELLASNPDINLILLDDAFQHRYVQPKVNILLTDYSRPVYTDHLLPLGRLRECRHNVGRADFVIVTKVPEELSPLQFRMVHKQLDLLAFQKLYFSRIRYGEIAPVFPEESKYIVHLDQFTRSDAVLLLTGIANPRSFVRYFKRYACRVKVNHFPDHHFYSRRDLEALSQQFDSMKAARKIIVTTEKDAVRLAGSPYFPQRLKPFIFYVPIEIEMVHGIDEPDFITTLRAAIDSNSENP